jgi:hypothetical protein
VWVGTAIVLILFAYAPTIINIIQTSGFNAPGMVPAP